MRKNISAVLLCLFITTSIQAQDLLRLKPFKIELGSGLTFTSTDGKGSVFYVEPGYTISGRYKLGLRLELEYTDMKIVNSASLTMDYYFFFKGRLSLFAGGSIGSYDVNEHGGGCSAGGYMPMVISNTKHLGGTLRTGMELHRFRLGLEYNFVPSTHVSTQNGAENSYTNSVYANRFFAIKAGIILGKRKSARKK